MIRILGLFSRGRLFSNVKYSYVCGVPGLAPAIIYVPPERAEMNMRRSLTCVGIRANMLDDE